MTRMLSELLGATEPNFSLNIRELERASGGPSADIRLSADILLQAQAKLRELGLDPQDTTGPELYNALQERLLQDEHRLRKSLGLTDKTSSQAVLSSIQRFTRMPHVPRNCFALRLSVAKRLMKKVPPKKSMKELGYRSLDSMLKHEPIPQLYAAALIHESGQWQQDFLKQYEKLSPSDFETRKITVFYPNNKRWEKLAGQFVDTNKHTSVVLKELGAIVILPVTVDLPALAITSVLLLLEGINDIRCSSTYLKLQQVKPNFGKLVAELATSEPYTSTNLAGQPLPWRIIHYYYNSRNTEDLPSLFEPHVQSEDLDLVKSEDTLAQEIPALEFWQDTPHLALVDHGQTVSFNMLDVALSVVNRLPFSDRVVSYVRDRIWHELLVRYLNPYNLERVLGQLNDELVEPEFAKVKELA